MSAADYTDSAKSEQRLRAAANKLHELAPAVAKARQVKEFSSDRRKNLLARYMAPLLIGGSVASAETTARADMDYGMGLDDLARQYREAEEVLAEWAATNATFEASRSLLSLSKELLRSLDG